MMNSNEQQADVPEDVVVILCSPSYTPLTNYTGKWLEDVPVPSGLIEHRLTGAPVSLRELIGDHTGGPRKHITIFCGHGIDDALLGPPLNDSGDLEDYEGARHSILYSTEPFEPNPKVLFAFCCNSATKLGTKFTATADASFLGFEGELSFVTCDEQCRDTLRIIVKRMAKRIIIDRDISHKHKKMLERFYDQAYNYYLNGKGRKNEYWWLMTLSLLQQKSLIRRYKGDSSNQPS
jgi:hypothetical protein